MKHILSFMLAVAMVFCVFPVFASAAEEGTNIVYLEDGSYYTIQTVTYGTRASGSKTGNKVYTHHDSDGTSNWKVTLTGSFTYTGSSATCTSSSVDVTIYDSNWYTISKSASKSGNTASASVTMGEKRGGVTVTKVPVSLTLTCDANGNLS